MDGDVWQQIFPTAHGLVERRTEGIRVHVLDRIETVHSGPPETRHPLGIQLLYTERAVARWPRLDGQQVEHLLQPASAPVRREGFNVCRKDTAVRRIIVVQSVHTG